MAIAGLQSQDYAQAVLLGKYIIYSAPLAESTQNHILQVGKWRPVKGLEPRILVSLAARLCRLSLSQFLLSCSFFFLSSLASSCSFSSLVKKGMPLASAASWSVQIVLLRKRCRAPMQTSLFGNSRHTATCSHENTSPQDRLRSVIFLVCV